ncbi:sucrose-6-phosphate hydrolase [Bacillus endophyticus]|uniref:glycoside hydrolase family 32 protein n=1 Tax=Priestia endophytica TaxID=135735 RepID=UPI0018CFE9D7|nr:sucrose-6-phosphate hydrolase [Priestia endophytica]MBG9813239.1 sucrose-6-phosphate hydrolase [Priestia endophytica]
MKMTKEEKYRYIEQARPDELEKLQKQIERCAWRQNYHIQPQTGLLNDPNGFSYYNGIYHLFYQWFPFGPEHGMKYWFHTVSKDLCTWENVGIGIKPGDSYDSHGVYSGSAIVKDEKLYLMYTGNTRDENWVRHPFQCMAYMNESGVIQKLTNPVISTVPNGYTDHFRDPKVWKKDDTYFCVIGAQRKNKTGCAVLYKSSDLMNWEFQGELETTLPSNFGYMWECPDYFELEEHGILLFSPQGLEAEGEKYQNIYQSGYLVGEPLDLETRKFCHDAFHELDRGFDFYAQHTTLSEDGRRLLIGWMGLPDLAYPTDQNGWAHCLTIPRQLEIREGKLIQQPISELMKLRKNERQARFTLENERKKVKEFSGLSYELIYEIENIQARYIGIEFRAKDQEKTVFFYDSIKKELVLDRSLSGKSLEAENGNIRRCSFSASKLKIQLFVDVSSVEIFINNGEEVFTSRIFPSPHSKEVCFFTENGSATFQAVQWSYE